MSLFGGVTESKDDYRLPKAEEYSLRERLNMEKETTGLYLSGHPMNEYAGLLSKLGSMTVAEIKQLNTEGPGEQNVRLAAIVLTKRMKTTKSSDIMAFVTLEDTTGAIEALVFPKVLTEYGGSFNVGDVVVLDARISSRDEEETKLVAEAFMSPKEALSRVGRSAMQAQNGYSNAGKSPKPAAGRHGVFIRVPSMESLEYEAAMKFMAVFQGLTPLYIYSEDTGKTMQAPSSKWVDAAVGDGYVIKRLEKLLGESNVKVR